MRMTHVSRSKLSSQRSLVSVATRGHPQQTGWCFGGGDDFLQTNFHSCTRSPTYSICSCHLFPQSDKYKSLETFCSVIWGIVCTWFTSFCSPTDSLQRQWLHYPSGSYRRHILHHQWRTGEEERWQWVNREQLAEKGKRGKMGWFQGFSLVELVPGPSSHRIIVELLNCCTVQWQRITEAVICDVYRWKSPSRTQAVTSRCLWRLCLKGTGSESRLWKGETQTHFLRIILYHSHLSIAACFEIDFPPSKQLYLGRLESVSILSVISEPKIAEAKCYLDCLKNFWRYFQSSNFQPLIVHRNLPFRPFVQYVLISPSPRTNCADIRVIIICVESPQTPLKNPTILWWLS